MPLRRDTRDEQRARPLSGVHTVKAAAPTMSRGSSTDIQIREMDSPALSWLLRVQSPSYVALTASRTQVKEPMSRARNARRVWGHYVPEVCVKD
jgi:hypothetical protein